MSKLESVSTVGDDLDDGLEYNVEFSSGEEINPDSELEDDNNASDEESKKAKTESEANNGKKRKAKTSKLQEKKKVKMEMDIAQKKNLSKESSTDVIADFINNKISQKNPNLSTLELSELYFNKTNFRSTSEFDEEKRSLDNLTKFILGRFKNMLPSHDKKNKKNKNKKNKKEDKSHDSSNNDKDEAEERKFIAIVSMSALRACDIHRATREISGSSLKLINKNKLDVDLKLVKTTRSRILCCTPGRLLKVLNSEDSELNKDEIKIIIVDNSYLDQKQQNIWDIKETPEALSILTKEGGSKIYLY
ncbi:DEHA2F26268p [Debaryomyces hansenii CBS767]|uniref:DEHA2F26268p n=1 Tax=Debaryomyces hansenii (strain ATCC 36239 / CBS 767 / BCRC 21394 / JCM 1990 / NBRC 0083 / IGC 2968) TaxID=284592 RepID=B5RUP0_DEBHA|nr:DEHA2F26268p [Debaryomyces hansenii CBS767]CAR66418.1 DEHA2F26268p [Debaryomyces hansenii CBS767]|eukprot:XP_002770902.1 DEHA2F26268p [Debaryomyces hansenii CBS767]